VLEENTMRKGQIHGSGSTERGLDVKTRKKKGSTK